MSRDTPVKVLEYATSQEAWEGLNEYFLNNSREITRRGGGRYGPQLISYDMFVIIRKAYVDPEFDFGTMFGYRMQKWTTLVNNYINLNYLDILKAQVLEKVKKRTPSYNLSMQFDNSHSSGKNCLLSLTISQRVNIDHPIMSFNLRSSEITKRLLWDLLLVQRISEYIFGKEKYVSIQLFCGNMYQNTESFIMYHHHRPLESILHVPEGKKLDIWQQRSINTLEEFLNVDPKKIKFKVHLRSVRQLQRVDGIPLSGDRPLRAKDCILKGDEDIPYPENCITVNDRKAFKQKFIRKQKRDAKK